MTRHIRTKDGLNRYPHRRTTYSEASKTTGDLFREADRSRDDVASQTITISNRRYRMDIRLKNCPWGQLIQPNFWPAFSSVCLPIPLPISAEWGQFIQPNIFATFHFSDNKYRVTHVFTHPPTDRTRQTGKKSVFLIVNLVLPMAFFSSKSVRKNRWPNSVSLHFRVIELGFGQDEDVQKSFALSRCQLQNQRVAGHKSAGS